MGTKLRHFALGPLLWRSVDRAEATSPLDQTAWQRGVGVAAAVIDNNRGIYGPILAVVLAVVGLFVGPGPLVVRVVVAVAIGLVVAWLVPTVVAAVVAIDAPRRQRDEARKYARRLDSHATAVEGWAARLERTNDFMWEAFDNRQRLLVPDEHYVVYEQDVRPAEEIEAEWRRKVETVAAQLTALGGDPEEIRKVVESGLAGLDRRDEGYGDNQRRRIWNNMGVIAQNMRVARGARPTKPEP